MATINFAIFSTLLLFGDVCGEKQARKSASEYFKICHRSDPDIENCIKNTIEDLRPRLIKGIPELDIVPLDPLQIPRIEFSDGSGSFKLRHVLTNLTIYGLRHFNLRRVMANMDNLTFDIDMQTQIMSYTSDYELDGRVLLLPITGKGDCLFNFTDVTTICHIVNKLVKRDGQEFLEVKDLKWDTDAKNVRVQFNNLFNGDKTLGDATNKFLNENWREAFETYRFLSEEAFAVLFKDFFNKVFQKFTYDELYPK